MELTNQRVVDAVNYLIEARNYPALIEEIRGIIDQWAAHPMAYGGQLRHLNALVDIGLQNRVAFDNLVELIEGRRKLLPRTKRTDYQRELMRDRRERVGKALQLHEALHGPIRGARRMEEASKLQARWAQARADFIKSKGPLSWAERNKAANEFWSMIDRQLEVNLQAARRKRA